MTTIAVPSFLVRSYTSNPPRHSFLQTEQISDLNLVAVVADVVVSVGRGVDDDHRRTVLSRPLVHLESATALLFADRTDFRSQSRCSSRRRCSFGRAWCR